MQEDLREKAKKKVEAKMAFFVIAAIFSAISLILIVISFQIGGSAAFWIRFPMLIFAMVLAIMYIPIFGLPYSKFMNEDWQEVEIEKEMARMQRTQRVELPPEEDLSEEDRLELKELQRLKDKWESGEEYV